MYIKRTNESGIIAGQARFSLPKLPQCERVDRCTYRLSFDDTGPMYFKVGMAMCNLWPMERRNIAFANAKQKLGKAAYGDTEGEAGKVPVDDVDTLPYRGWLAKMVIFIEKEEEPILTLYVDPHEFNHMCVPFNNTYSDERIMKLLELLHAAYYTENPNVSANELVALIQKQCEDTLGSICMYDIMCGDDKQAELEREIIATHLSNPDIKNMAISGCHGRIAIGWIREKYQVVPYTAEP